MSGTGFVQSTVEFACAEFSLRVRENVFHRGELQQVARIARTETEAFTAVDDGASQAERNGGDSVGKGHRLYRIKVVRTHDAGEVGIEALTMLSSYDLLQNHRHLFFFQTIGGCAYIHLRVLTERRSIYALDGFAQFVEANLQLRMLIAQHEGLINSGERLILRIFEQARR